MSQESQQSVPLQIKVDSEGFLRRACGSCGREFKRRVLAKPAAAPRGGYCCPYCGERAPENERFTPHQRAFIERAAEQLVALPEARAAELEAFEGDPADFVSSLPEPQPVEPLLEADDMKVWVLACHPGEPFKVAENWSKPVRCIVCGAST